VGTSCGGHWSRELCGTSISAPPHGLIGGRTDRNADAVARCSGCRVSELPACRLVLLRNEKSDWIAWNLFTGWINVGLTATGEQQPSQAPAFPCSTALGPI
jgi:hypothetical protein